MATQLAEREEQYRAFAKQLRELAERYESNAIMNFVNRYLEAEGHNSLIASRDRGRDAHC